MIWGVLFVVWQENILVCESEGGAGWGVLGRGRPSWRPLPSQAFASRSRDSTPHNLCTRWPAAHAYSHPSPCAHSTLLLFHFVTWFCSQAALHWFANVPRMQLVWLRSRNPWVIRWTVPVRWEGAFLARHGESSAWLAEPGRGVEWIEGGEDGA